MTGPLVPDGQTVGKMFATGSIDGLSFMMGLASAAREVRSRSERVLSSDDSTDYQALAGLALDLDDALREAMVAASTVSAGLATAPEKPRCECEWAGYLNHDGLLEVESMSFPDLVEFLEMTLTQPELDPSLEMVPWWAYREFFACHSYPHQLAMHRLAGILIFATHFIEEHQRRAEAEMGL